MTQQIHLEDSNQDGEGPCALAEEMLRTPYEG